MNRNVRLVFRALVVAWAGLVAGPMLPLVLDGPTWPLFGVGAAAGLGGGYALVRLEDPTRMVTRARLTLATVAPLGYLLAVRPAVERSGIEGLAEPATAGAFASVPAYLALLLLIGADRHERETEGNPRLYTFEARVARGTRRRIAAATIAVVVVSTGTGMALLRFDGSSYPGLGVLTASAASVVAVYTAVRSPRRVTITEDGLLIQGRLHGWDSFEGFSMDERRLVFRARRWWRVDYRFDVGDMDEPRTVYRALSRHL